MPANGGYVLTEEAVYALSGITTPGPMDIAPATSLLWMAVNNKVRLDHGMRCHLYPSASGGWATAVFQPHTVAADLLQSCQAVGCTDDRIMSVP